MTSDPNKTSHVDESRFKTILVVLITVAALIFLAIRPLLDGGENQADQKGRDQTENSQTAKSDSNGKPDKSAQNNSETKTEGKSSSGKESANGTLTKKTASNTEDVRSKSKHNPKTRPSNGNQKTRGPPVNGKSSNENPFPLTKVSKDTYRSAAGLIYGPGSRDGNRLKHVLKHAKDDLSKPVHGVFDGTDNEILLLIDQAYERIRNKHRSVSESRQGKRTVYSVYYGKRIGFVGGQTGKRKNKPLAKTLVLVLEKNRVITAYPK